VSPFWLAVACAAAGAAVALAYGFMTGRWPFSVPRRRPPGDTAVTSDTAERRQQRKEGNR
jgi:hypothetical protein